MEISHPWVFQRNSPMKNQSKPWLENPWVEARRGEELPLGCWEMQQNPWGGESLQGAVVGGALGRRGIATGSG